MPDFPVLYRILLYCLVNIHPQAGKDDVRGEGCNAGGAHDNLREGGGLEDAGGEEALYCPIVCQAPPPHPPSPPSYCSNVYGRGQNV